MTEKLKCNLCGELVSDGIEARQHQRSHGADTYYTDCFGDASDTIRHPLTGEIMTAAEFEALREKVRWANK